MELNQAVVDNLESTEEDRVEAQDAIRAIRTQITDDVLENYLFLTHQKLEFKYARMAVPNPDM